ncbi:hypothetical protein K469DRAFT_77261 [Zopfia rhizophila CBS 207.26]|uniref:Uncharacterized protein n=1 Tax=Zopfia rhizophila CBS 207.26 TaxID=1314779 RepID=A0A6A6DC16_9PEZI|nr:hypothetical protein K469DRAFT_77261 [Zopfia rhizophila CBS 207.26]
MTSRLSVTRKRKHPLYADTVTSVEVLDLTTKPAPEDSFSAKRRRPAQPRVESLIFSPLCTPKSTPPPARGTLISPLKTSSGLSVSNLGGGGKVNSADIPDLPRSDLLDLVNSGNGERHRHGVNEELLEPLRQSVSPTASGRTDGDPYVKDLCEGEDKRNGSNDKVGESDEDELNGDQNVSCRAGTATSQQYKDIRAGGRCLQEHCDN